MVSHGIWMIWPRDFASWPAEFGKIFRGKLWALIISSHCVKQFCVVNVNLTV